MYYLRYFLLLFAIYALTGCNWSSYSNSLSGAWIGKGYKCYSENDYLEELVDIQQYGDSIIATKVGGDDCVTSGQVTWRGKYDGRAREIIVEAQVGNLTDPNNKFVSARLTVQGNDTLILTSIDSLSRILFVRVK